MSTELINSNLIKVTRFNGGKERGTCAVVKLNQDEFTLKELAKLIKELNKVRKSFT